MNTFESYYLFTGSDTRKELYNENSKYIEEYVKCMVENDQVLVEIKNRYNSVLSDLITKHDISTKAVNFVKSCFNKKPALGKAKILNQLVSKGYITEIKSYHKVLVKIFEDRDAETEKAKVDNLIRYKKIRAELLKRKISLDVCFYLYRQIKSALYYLCVKDVARNYDPFEEADEILCNIFLDECDKYLPRTFVKKVKSKVKIANTDSDVISTEESETPDIEDQTESETAKSEIEEVADTETVETAELDFETKDTETSESEITDQLDF